MTIEVFDSYLNTTAMPPLDRHIPSVFREFYPFVLTGTPLKYCDQIKPKADGSLENGFYASIAILSICSSIIVGLMIFYNPKLRIHPSKLIGYMCMCEAASCFSALIWVINPRQYVCYFGLHYLWSYTTW
jgi:hypothetical protein